MKFKIGEIEFDSKKSAEDFIRQKILSFKQDDQFWFDLIELHPEAKEKIGVGIDFFFLTPNPYNARYKQLNISRKDSSMIDFSWKSCVAGKMKPSHLNRREAMRTAIRSQIVEFKKTTTTCASCGSIGDEVDHVSPSFSDLARNYEKQNMFRPETFDDCPKFNSAKFKPEDAEFEFGWQKFHRENAVLQLLCVKCHLEKTQLDNK